MKSATSVARKRRNRPRGIASFQVEIKVKRPKGVRLTRALLQEAVENWAAGEDAPSGMSIRVVHWKIREGYQGKDTSERESDVIETEAEKTRERFGRLLQEGRVDIQFRRN